MQKNPIDDEKTVFHCLMNYMSIIGLESGHEINAGPLAWG